MEGLTPPQSQQPPKQADSKKKRAPAKKKMRFKVTRFDKDLASLVKNGVTDLDNVMQKLGVDPANFRARLDVLIEKGYFVFNKEANSLKLGWEGYNMFAPKARKQSSSSLPQPLSEQKSKQTEAPAAKQEENDSKKNDELPVRQEDHLPSVQIIPAPHTAEDLAELLRKGSPKNDFPSKGSFFTQRQEKKETAQEPKTPLDTGKALLLEGAEACEICKAKFKLNVKNTGDSKYGHCFCGAAYHKDCYESMLENGGHCVRCGRKLKLMFDKKTEDAVKGIKDVFE